MTENNFDELDRAVQAAINGNPIESSIAARRGRFMDVVSSKNDEFTPAKPAVKSTKIAVHNSGRVIDPSFSAVKPRPTTKVSFKNSIKISQAPIAEKKPEIKTEPASEVLKTTDAVKPLKKPAVNPFFPNGMPEKQSADKPVALTPEPLGQVAKVEKTLPEDSEIVKTVVKTEPEPVAAEEYDEDKELEDELDALIESAINEDKQALETPFLPGAKVEKRPLGSPSPYIGSAQMALSSKIEVTSDEVEDSAETIDDNNEDLISLDDLTSIEEPTQESQDAKPEPKETTSQSLVASQTKPAPELKESDAPKPSAKKNSDKNVPIYDTNDYLSPVIEEKPVSFKWAILLFVIAIIVGVAVGATYFLLNNQ